jgi:hypothetical protein
MPIDYCEFRKIAERAKARGLITHPTRKKRGPPKQKTGKAIQGKLGRPCNPPRSKYHWAIFKIACLACGAAKGECCKPTIGLTEDIPVHASRIHDAERA